MYQVQRQKPGSRFQILPVVDRTDRLAQVMIGAGPGANPLAQIGNTVNFGLVALMTPIRINGQSAARYDESTSIQRTRNALAIISARRLEGNL